MTLQTLLGNRRLQIVDIGARGGAHQRWNRYRDVLNFVGFEAEPAECARLNANAPTGHRFLPYGLSDRNETQTFHVCEKPGYSSLYEPHTQFVAQFDSQIHADMNVVKRVPVTTTTLDAVPDLPQADALKIDVQGAELDILKGGLTTLRRTKLVELEVEFNEQYRGQPLFADVDAFMRSQGFQLLGLRRTFWRRTSPIPTVNGGQLIHGDVLYFNMKALATDHDCLAEMIVWAALLSAYSQDDFVEAILARQVFNEQRDTVRAAVRVSDSRGLLNTIGRRIAAEFHHRQLRSFVDGLRSGTAIDWHDPEFF